MIRADEQTLPGSYRIGWLTLAAPSSLNALTLEMACFAQDQLARWAADPAIVAVVLQGEGRAFCAGGDVRRMRAGILAGDDYCERFFEQEYRLDHAIHTYTKPLLAWGHGVVMGGGLGLLVGASHRVATSSTRFAMPETSIGLYPDVGASHFLNRLPDGLGLFLGISGCEWNAADAVALGLADHALDDAGRECLPDLLTRIAWHGRADHDGAVLHAALASLAPATVQPQLLSRADALAAICRQTPLAQLPMALAAMPIAETWFQQAVNNLERGCPVTARLVEKQLQRGKGIGLADAFRMEWNLSVNCCHHPDFPEGVRAQLVDKDKCPRWSFPDIASVPDAYVAAHFEPAANPHPLQDLGTGLVYTVNQPSPPGSSG